MFVRALARMILGVLLVFLVARDRGVAIDLFGGGEKLGLEFGERLVGVGPPLFGGLGRRFGSLLMLRRQTGRRGFMARLGRPRSRSRRIERPGQFLERLRKKLG